MDITSEVVIELLVAYADTKEINTINIRNFFDSRKGCKLLERCSSFLEREWITKSCQVVTAHVTLIVSPA